MKMSKKLLIFVVVSFILGCLIAGCEQNPIGYSDDYEKEPYEYSIDTAYINFNNNVRMVTFEGIENYHVNPQLALDYINSLPDDFDQTDPDYLYKFRIKWCGDMIDSNFVTLHNFLNMRGNNKYSRFGIIEGLMSAQIGDTLRLKQANIDMILIYVTPLLKTNQITQDDYNKHAQFIQIGEAIRL